jgi:hypothetical protein
MATANIDLPDGTKVRIDGTPEEINKILGLYSTKSYSSVATDISSGTTADKRRKNSTRRSTRMSGGVMQHIRELIDDGFFIQKRSISDVQLRLEEVGHIYPLTHLSTPLRRLTQSRELRRIREANNWAYANS